MISEFRPHIVFGLGDGSVLEQIPSACKVYLLLFPGEHYESPPREWIRAHSAADYADAASIVRRWFAAHSAIVTLASAEILDSHPLAPEAEKLRSEWAPRLIERMCHHIEDLGNDPLDTWQGAKHALSHGAQLAHCPTTDDLFDHYKGLPAICIGAGPSAEAELDTIAKAQDNAVLFCTDAMLGACKARGIAPDFVCSFERLAAITKMMKDTGGTPDGSTLLAPPIISPEVVEEFKGRVLWYWRPDMLERWLDPTVIGRNTGNSCGTMSVAAAMIAGCDPIYLVGHDLCSDDAGKTHSPSAAPMAQLPEDANYVKPIPTVAADGRPVFTTRLWSAFRGDIEFFLTERGTRQIYNVGRGLAISGATQTFRLPVYWRKVDKPPKPTRYAAGRDPNESREILKTDCNGIIAECQYLLAKKTPIDPNQFVLSKMVGESTYPLWHDIFRALYHGGLFRMHLRENGDTHRLIAGAIMGVAAKIKAEL